MGNHEGLVQGDFPQLLQLSLVSTGALKLMSMPAGLSPAELLNTLQGGDLVGLLQSLALTPAERLLSHPEVVASINGHTHRNTVVAHARPECGGLWEINTASHIDWPQ
jgi:hypothetical protein